MALIPQFNAMDYSPAQTTGQLPIGRHKVVIDSSELKPTSAGDGAYLQLMLKVIDGPNAGDSGAYRLNIQNKNEMTVSIAKRQLSAICHVTGVFDLHDSAQLHGIPFVIEVGVQKKDPQYTEVKRVFDINEGEPWLNKNAQNSYQTQPPQAAASATEIQDAPVAPAAPAKTRSAAPWNKNN